MIFSNQDITGTDGECLTTYSCKFEHTGQRNDVLRNWVIVPVIRGMGWRFVEEDGLRVNQFTFIDAATHHMRISIGTGVETVSADHFSTSLVKVRAARHAIPDFACAAGWPILLSFNTSAVSARTCWHKVAFSMSD